MFKKNGQTRFSAAVLWLGLAASCVASEAGLSGTQSLTLGWTASSDPTVVGYYVYFGDATGSNTHKVNVGTNTVFTVEGLVAGQSYSFWTTSCNASDMESVPTAKISYVAPVPGILSVSPSAGKDAMTISFPAASGCDYELQASPDLMTWNNIWSFSSQSNALVEYNEPFTNAVLSRFFRLVSMGRSGDSSQALSSY
jgi:hypothetical protein